MSYPHIIRLRGPWQFRCDDLSSAGRATVPADWGGYLGSGFRGRVLYRRSFNRPATLDPHERLWLVVEGVDAFGEVSLNGARLGTIHGYALERSFEVTELLGRRNEVELVVELPAELPETPQPLRPGRERLPGGPIGEVRLEVRSQWFIESLAIWSTPGSEDLFIRGHIQGEQLGQPLAVVVSGCEREVTYLESSVGSRFETLGPAPDFPVWRSDLPTLAPLEVKLLSGGTAVWQSNCSTALRTPVAELDAVIQEQVLPNAAYHDFDRSGQPILQRVPLEWAEQVCSKLAYHPSIVAWMALPHQSPPSAPTYGRQWLTYLPATPASR